MKVIGKYLKKFKTIVTKYFYTNRLFITYLLIAISGAIILRNITIGGTFSFKPLATDIGLILLIGSIGYLFKPKNQFKYFFILLIIFTIIEVINSVYYIFYTSFASLGELSTLSQAETVTDSIFNQLRLVDFIYVLQPIIFYYIHHNLKLSHYYNLLGKIEKKKTMMLATFLCGFIFLGYSFATATKSDYSRLNKQWNRSYIVERFGILLYQANDVLQTIKPKISSLFGYEDALKLFDDYFNNPENLKNNQENKYTGILEGYNIVYVHMESMQNFLMDLSFNGTEVTPNLNNLAKEGMFFSNFYPQISTGTSSDAEYIMLTGLLPSASGTVFVSYADNTFKTMASYLKERGYYTFSMHGNYASMWNRSHVHPRLGYTDMYYREEFTFTDADKIGLGINDKLFFEQAISKLATIENTYENYFGTIITLSNHSPFKHHDSFTLDLTDYYTDEVTEEQLSSCYLCERDIGRYIISSHYADEALGDFLKYIKESSQFDNTIFIFYGDHDAKISYKDMNYLYNYDYLTGDLKLNTDPSYQEYDSYDHNLHKKTPLIFWTKNKEISKKLHGKVDKMMGMYDAAPTLFNMLNIDNKYTLGKDIFNITDDNIIIFPTGNFLTENVYYNNSTGEYKILKEGAILDNDYIATNLEYTEKALEVGNSIIMYDLFNERKKNE